MVGRRYAERWRSWREMIRRQADSGLSVAAFCREQQVAPASFFAWRKKLAKADQQAESQAPGQDASGSPESRANALPERDVKVSHAARAQFVPIELSPGTLSSANFEIVHPDGYRVVVPARFEAESLREILLVLKEVASC
jgi:hypothetical protein